MYLEKALARTLYTDHPKFNTNSTVIRNLLFCLSHSLSFRPVPSRKNQDKLVKLKVTKKQMELFCKT